MGSGGAGQLLRLLSPDDDNAVFVGLDPGPEGGRAFVGVGREVGLAHFASAAGDVNGLRLVRAGAGLAAAAGDVNGLRLVLAGAAGEVYGPSLDSFLTWDVDDVTELFHFLTQKF